MVFYGLPHSGSRARIATVGQYGRSNDHYALFNVGCHARCVEIRRIWGPSAPATPHPLLCIYSCRGYHVNAPTRVQMSIMTRSRKEPVTTHIVGPRKASQGRAERRTIHSNVGALSNRKKTLLPSRLSLLQTIARYGYDVL